MACSGGPSALSSLTTPAAAATTPVAPTLMSVTLDGTAPAISASSQFTATDKKWENHAAMVALYFMYYNFGRVHQTLRVTPAMEAGIADHVWPVEEIVGLLN
jgi:hypothetical protein